MLIIGRIDGMEPIVASAVQVARNTMYQPSVDAIFDPTDAAGFCDGAEPQLIVALQHWPDEFSSKDITRLFTKYPLSRWIVCQGPWCASAGRTRRLWPAAITVFEHNFAHRLDREVEVLHGHRLPLHWTATPEEVFAFDSAKIVH